jgi:23S rRNA (uracil1939-C5)-methyltransferase
MARKNAAANGIENCTFEVGEVRGVLAERPEIAGARPIVVLDPPRAGLHADIVDVLRRLDAPRIVYVSCNPATLARDLQLLCAGDRFALQHVQPVDMFPHTLHIECVATLVPR